MRDYCVEETRRAYTISFVFVPTVTILSSEIYRLISLALLSSLWLVTLPEMFSEE
jgi:hypothetical protein